MKRNSPWSTTSSICALLLGVILFWAFGRDWLNLGSALIFVMGLLGVTVSVLGFSLWTIHNHSDHKENCARIEKIATHTGGDIRHKPFGA